MNVTDFGSVDELIDIIGEKIQAYEEKYGKYPRVIAFDSVSKIYETVASNCDARYTGFDIHTNLNKEITRFNKFIEQDIVAQGVDVIFISHAMYDEKNNKHKLVAQGRFAQRGGYYAEVEEAIYISHKKNKRTLLFRASELPARTLQLELPDSIEVTEFNLQDHLTMLREKVDSVADYSL